MNPRQAQTATRKVETQIEIAAPVEAVWKALTDAEELVRWFPLEAKVTPGAGGSFRISWGSDFMWDTRIEVWEPNRHLRTVTRQAPFAAEESSGASPQAREIAVDYLLESKGGKAVLRLVHSGFGSGADWDEEFEGVRCGWEAELRSLRQYLEKHAGKARLVCWIRQPFSVAVEQAWARLTGAGGLAPIAAGHELHEGQPYSVETAAGDRLQGIITSVFPLRSLSATVENLNHAIFRVEIYKYAGHHIASVWLSTWGVPGAQMDSFRSRWTELAQNDFSGLTESANTFSATRSSSSAEGRSPGWVPRCSQRIFPPLATRAAPGNCSTSLCFCSVPLRLFRQPAACASPRRRRRSSEANRMFFHEVRASPMA